jgi:hypothetical protein
MRDGKLAMIASAPRYLFLVDSGTLPGIVSRMKAEEIEPLANKPGAQKPKTPEKKEALVDEPPRPEDTTERRAGLALRTAKDLLEEPSTRAKGESKLRDLIDKYPKTKAAEEARKLLGDK